MLHIIRIVSLVVGMILINVYRQNRFRNIFMSLHILSMLIALGISIHFFVNLDNPSLIEAVANITGMIILTILVKALLDNDKKTIKTYGYLLNTIWIGIDIFSIIL